MKLCFKKDKYTFYVSESKHRSPDISLDIEEAVDIKDIEIITSLLTVGFIPVVTKKKQKGQQLIKRYERHGEITD